ncbi:hypothetical protein [Teichococcus aestuarii]
MSGDAALLRQPPRATPPARWRRRRRSTPASWPAARGMPTR